MTSVLLAVTAALFWGVSDFLGGATTGSLPVTRVLAVSQAAGLVLVTVFALARGDALPHGRHLLEAGGAGVAAIAALGLLYVGLARGNAILVAPLAATGAAVPVAVGFVRGDPVRAVNVAGIALAFAGVITTSIEPGDRDREGGPLIVVLALGAGAATGLYFTLIGMASVAGAVGTTETVRISATATALTALAWTTRATWATRTKRPTWATRAVWTTRPTWATWPTWPMRPTRPTRGSRTTDPASRPRRDFPLVPAPDPRPAPAPDPPPRIRARLLWPAVLAVGLTDGLAEVGYAASSATGPLSVVSVLAGSYPAVTVLLAVAILRQRAHPVQAVGAAGTIAGVLLLAAGSG